MNKQIISKDQFQIYLLHLESLHIPLHKAKAKLTSVLKFIHFLHEKQVITEVDFDQICNLISDTTPFKVNQLTLSYQSPAFLAKDLFLRPFKLKKPVDNSASSIQNLGSSISISPRNLIAAGMLLVFVGALGLGLYTQFIKKVVTPFAYPGTPVTPGGTGGRIVSFQGRLTDSLGNPITSAVTTEYNFYTVSTGGTAIPSSQRICTAVTPDQDGVFNNLIGSDPGCNTELPNSIFTENPAVYLGVKVASDPEMTPRQQIANVGYAVNSETLQGLPPGSSVSNIPIINSSGDLLIGAATPGVRNTYASATFMITSANAITMQSAGAGDVSLIASGSGTIKLTTGATPQLTVANNGNILTGTGTITFPNLSTTGIVHNSSAGLLSTSALNLAGGASEVTGILPIASGGTNGSATPILGAVPYGTGTVYGFTAAPGSNSLCLLSNTAGAPTWSSCSGAVTVRWDQLQNPTANLSLAMADKTSTFTYNATTGASNLFNLTDTSGNTGTGYLLNVTTASTSTLKPFHVSAAGTEALSVLANGNVGIGITSAAAKLDTLLTSASVTGASEIANKAVLTDTGIVTSGTDTSYGIYTALTRTGATGGTINSYGNYITLTADNAGAGTSVATGLYVDTTNAAADTNYAAQFVGGNVKITNGSYMLHNITTASLGLYFNANSGVPDTGYFIGRDATAWGSGQPIYAASYYGWQFQTNGANQVRIDNTGKVGIGTSVPGAKLEVADTSILASESLTNGALTAGASWTQTGDMALASDAATYTHSTGVGTLSQASGTLAIAGNANRLYAFTYTISAVSGTAPVAQITTAFAASAQTLTTSTNGTYTLYFRAAAAPGNFTISVTSGATGAFTIDTLSLKEVTGGNTIVNGLLTGGGSTGIKVNGSGNVGIGITTPNATTSLDTAGRIRVGTLNASATNQLCYDGSNILSTCAVGSSVATLQSAYNNGNTITTTSGNNIAFTLAAALGTPTSLTLTNNHVSNATDFNLVNANASGTNTNGVLVNQTGAGTLTNGLNITQTSGAVTNALTLTGTFTKLINSTNFNVTNAGAVTAVGVNSGAGLLQGALGLTITGATANINATGTNATNIGNSTGALVVASGGTSSWTNTAGGLTLSTVTSGSLNITSAGTSTFSIPANTASAFRFTDGTNAYETINTQTATSGVSAFTWTPGTAPTIASASTAFYNAGTFTPGTINFSGSTQITSTGTSANNALLFNQPTINRTAAATNLTIDQAANLFVNGAAKATHATGGQTETITTSAALRIGAGASLAGTNGAVTNGYGLYVDPPTGATNNYAATFTGGNVGIGTTAPGEKLDVAGNINVNTNGTNALFSTFKPTSTDGNNLFIGGGGQSSVYDGSNSDSGSYNTAVGIGALYSNTTGSNNSAQGTYALYSNTTGYYNSAQGASALYYNTGGAYNSAQGASALISNSTGYYNSAQGTNTLQNNTTGSYNSAQGAGALIFNTTGSNNSAQGASALHDLNITANDGSGNNTAVGYNTGRGIVTGINNTILGANVTGLAAGLSNRIIIADGSGNQRIYVDNTGNVGIGTTGPTSLFHVVGSQPTSVAGATGTAATTALTLTGGTGGDTTIATTGTGGIGGGLGLTGGTGGVAGSATTQSTGGHGGILANTGGTGGGATVTGGIKLGGDGGDLNYSGGNGGATSGTGTSDTGGAGGTISLSGGTGGNAAGATTNTGGNGGPLALSGGNAGTGGNANGGSLYLVGGTLTGSGTAGNVLLGITSGGTSRGIVGVGTTAPTATTSLDVNGRIRVATLNASASNALCYDASNILSTCAAGGSTATLQSAYGNGNTITTTTGRDISYILAAGLGTPTAFNLTNNHVTNATDFNISNANASGTNTNGILVTQAAAGTLTNGLNITNTSGVITNGLSITNSTGTMATGITISNAGTLTNAISTPGFALAGTGAITTTFAGSSTNVYSITASSLTTGSGIIFTGPTSTGITGAASGVLALSSDVGSAGTSGQLVYLAPDFSAGSGTTAYGIKIAGTDSTAIANEDYGIYSGLTLTGNANKKPVGIYGTVLSSSTTAETFTPPTGGNPGKGGITGLEAITSVTGVITTATRDIFGVRSQPLVTSANTGGTTNIYGGYFAPNAAASTTGSIENIYGAYINTIGTLTTAGTINQYGLYIANGTSAVTGTSIKYGLYVESPTGAGTNYAATFAGGNVGIGTTVPGEKLDVAGNIKLSTANSIVTGATGLQLQETGDTYGTVNLYLQNRGGVNGAMFEQAGSVDLVDFVLKGLANQRNIRYENRGGSTNFAGTPEFQFGTPGSPNLVMSDGGTVVRAAKLGINSTTNCGSGCGLPSSNFGVNGNASIGSSYYSTAATTNGLIVEGNVGIGVTNPSYQLDVLETAAARGLNVSNTFAGVTTYAGYFSKTGGATNNIGLYATASGAGTSNYAAIFDQGNVGIGLTNPGTTLDVTGDGRFSSTLTASRNFTLTTGALNLTATSGSIDLTGFGTSSITSTTATGNINTFADSSFVVAAAATGNLMNLSFTNGSTNSTGTSTVTGLNIAGTNNAASSIGISETYGIRIQDLAGTAGTGTQKNYGIRIGNQGLASSETSYGLYVDSQTGSTNSYAAVFAGGNVGIGNTAPAAKLDIDSTQTSGNLINVGAPSAVTLAGALDGLNIDLSTNYTANGQSIDGQVITLPADSSMTSSTKRGFAISGGAMIQNTAGPTTATWRGIDVTNPAVTLTAGLSFNSDGVRVTTGNLTQSTGTVTENAFMALTSGSTITTNGTLNGFYLQAAGVGAGTLNGLNISNITGGAGAETGIKIGTGWDTGLSIAGGGMSVVGNTILGSRNNAQTVTTTQTITEATAANVFFLSNTTGTTATVTPTVTFNLTGVSTTDGTVLYLTVDAIKAASLTASTSSVNVTINGGGNIFTTAVTTGSSIGAITSVKNAIIVRSNGVWRLQAGVSATDQAADLAEWIPSVGQKPVAGEIVSSSDQAIAVKRTDTSYDSKILGIVATDPYLTMSVETETSVRLALSGRVPLRVSTENGPIQPGDYITSSSIPGVGMKATHAGPTVGKALESYENTDPTNIGTIMVFVNTSYYQPLDSGILTSTGDLNITPSKDAVYHGNLAEDTNAVNSVSFSLTDSAGNIISKIGAYSEIVTGKIQGGLAQFGHVIIDGTLVAKNATIGTLTALNGSIDNLTTNILTANQKITSPVVETDKVIANNINTNELTVEQKAQINEIDAKTIKPQDDKVTIDLSPNQNSDQMKQLIIKGLNNQNVASIDSAGNATFSGTLAARDATISGQLAANEASVSGTLTAGEIKSGNIDALSNKTNELSTQNSQLSTNVNDIQKLLNDIKNQPLPNPQYYQTLDPKTDYGISTQAANMTGTFSNLTGSQITVTDKATLYNVFVGGNLTAGLVTIQDNEILALSSELRLSALSSINFLDGAVVVDRSGKITSHGAIVAQGGIETNSIKSLNPQDDINVKLNNGTHNSSLVISNSQGAQVASVDASGSATFKDLALDSYSATPSAVIAEAQNFAQNGVYAPAIKTNSAATGTGILPAHKQEILMYNNKVTSKSLIYVTATSATQNKSLFVAQKVAGQYFKIAIDSPLTADVTFNWWIVN